MDPLTLIGVYVSTYKTFDFIGSLYYGPHASALGDGFSSLCTFLEENDYNEDHINSALSSFNKIDSNDKDFAIAGALYGKAICYAFKNRYKTSYSCLRQLSEIKVSWNSVKKDTLESFLEQGPGLKKAIMEMEKDYNRRRGGGEAKKRNPWKLLAVVLVLIIIGMCVLLFQKW